MEFVSLTCYLAFLVTAVFGLGDKFYTLQRVTSWEQANRSCTLATPILVYSEQGLTLDFGDNSEGFVGEYWVGYTTHSTILKYIGCSNATYEFRLSTRYYTNLSLSPGTCYSACGTDVFGVRDKYCYCFTNRTNRAFVEQTCNRYCTQAGIKCGGERSVSIFEVANLTMLNFTSMDTEYCIAYDLVNHAFIWEDCNRKLRAQRCQTLSGHTLMTSSEGKTWSESAEDCFSVRNTYLPVDVDVDNKDPYWTEYFRTDDYIRSYKDDGKPVMYGHVNIQNKTGLHEIRFGSDKGDFDAICVGNKSSTMFTTVTENIQSAPANTDSTMLTTVKAESTQSTTSTPGMQATTMLTKAAEITVSTPEIPASTNFTTVIESTASTPANTTKYLPIQIGVPLLISVCLGVVCVICCRKRRSKIKPSTPTPNIVEQYSQVQDPYDDVQNVYNEPFDKAIERHTNTSKHEHKNRSVPTDESEYDTTCVVGKRATERCVGDNVYNTLELVTDDTYDHVNGPNNKRDTRADKPCSRNAKVGYGVVTENTYDRVDIEEGSYSHINAGIRKQEATDNVYNLN